MSCIQAHDVLGYTQERCRAAACRQHWNGCLKTAQHRSHRHKAIAPFVQVR